MHTLQALMLILLVYIQPRLFTSSDCTEELSCNFALSVCDWYILCVLLCVNKRSFDISVFVASDFG